MAVVVWALAGAAVGVVIVAGLILHFYDSIAGALAWAIGG